MKLTDLKARLENEDNDYDLEQTDDSEDENTPLHHLLQVLHYNKTEQGTETLKHFLAIWKSICNVSVRWYATRKLGTGVPSEDDSRYKIYQRDAMFYLRSVVLNKAEETVLQYAASLGLSNHIYQYNLL